MEKGKNGAKRRTRRRSFCNHGRVGSIQTRYLEKKFDDFPQG
jgi:TnpA family transposase